MTYNDVYNTAVEDLMNMWNEFCLEHDREKLIVYTMADWRREVDYSHNITWLLDRLDTERFNPNHEYVAFDTCDDVWCLVMMSLTLLTYVLWLRKLWKI